MEISILFHCYVLLAMMLFLGATRGCDQPVGWSSKNFMTRAREADVVIVGTFIEMQNVTTSFITEINIITQVDCILKNRLDMVIPSRISIVEESPTFRCVNNMVSVAMGEKNFMFIHSETPEKIYFTNVNVQLALETYTAQVETDLIQSCDFRNVSLPATSEDDEHVPQCPAIDEDADSCNGGIDGTSAPVSGTLLIFILTFITVTLL